MAQSYDPATAEPEGDPLVPRPPRHNVLLSAVVERFGGIPATRHRVRDLSAGGVRIDQAAAMRPGATVLVTVGALEAVGATVVWVKDGWAGLRFAQPINPDDARAKTMISPRPSNAAPAEPSGTTPSSGWMRDLRDAYRD